MGISEDVKKGRRAIESAASELSKMTTFLTNDVWSEIESTVTEVKKTTTCISDEAWPELKSNMRRTMTFVIEEVWPEIKILLLLVAMSLALPFILYAAYQARRLLSARYGQPTQGGQQPRRTCCRLIEGMVLQFIYWFCLALALILTINIISLLIQHSGHLFQFTWVDQFHQTMEYLQTYSTSERTML